MNKKIATNSGASSLITRLRTLLKEKDALCIIGYGLSGEAGAPHFHDIVKGVWSQLSPSSNFNPFASPKHYRMVIEWFEWRKRLIERMAKDNAFEALKMLLHDSGQEIATQCVDGLIRRSGIGGHELYGNVFELRCVDHGHTFPIWASPKMDSEWRLICPNCGALLFPNVAMFGWNRMDVVREEVASRIAKAPILLLIGADRLIAPFSDLPQELPSKLPVVEILEGAVSVSENNKRDVLTVGELRKHLGESPESPANHTIEMALKTLRRAIDQ